MEFMRVVWTLWSVHMPVTSTAVERKS